ncbi:MAG: DNA polymerase I [Caldilineaceae bacterium]
MPLLLLIDGHSQAYRAYFGMKTPLSTREGEPTGAVYGFARKLLSVLKEYKPDHVAVAFDLGDTWRHSEFGDYKATRDAMPDDMRTQMTRIEQMLKAFNIPIITYPNYEADDVLGTLSKQAAEQGQDVLIMTGDRDMFQLVTDRIKILYTSGGPNPVTSIYSAAEIQERYALNPQQFIDFKSLIGDSSDNIPGVPGVGEKTAVKFLQQYNTLDNLYDHINEISGQKVKQALLDAKPLVERNRRLVTIVTQLDDLLYDAAQCRLHDYDPAPLIDLFNKLEFRSLIKELPQADGVTKAEVPISASSSAQMSLFGEAESPTQVSATVSADAPKYLTVRDEATLQRVVQSVRATGRLSFDVETTSVDALTAQLVGLGIAWAAGEAVYIPISHKSGEQLPWDTVRNVLQPLFADPAILKMAHNGKYDLTVLLEHGLNVEGAIHDTMTLAWLLDPASRSLGLKAQAYAELGWTMTEITELIGTGRKQVTIDEVPVEAVAAYCGSDVDATIQLFDKLLPRVQSEGMGAIYQEIELPLLPVLTDMERAGVQLDLKFLGEMSKRLGTRLVELEDELVKLVGHPFNLRSTQQMSDVLFKEMAFPTKGVSKTASGHYSTAVQELERLYALKDELSDSQRRMLEIIFEQRQLEKLRGTYVDALPTQVNPKTGRIHTNFNQTGAATGRMSSSNPNLQNIPIRSEMGREIRRAFIVPSGCILISADYSQIELRILAHVAQEETLLAAFRADQDIHAATASKLFRIPIEQVNKDQRGLAKTINFATIYGSSAFGISSRTDMTTAEADRFLTQYFETYPRIRQYIEATTQMVREHGFVQTLLGRKRYFPELSSGRLPFNQRAAIERAAINAPIQGTAADIMKIAMVRLHDELAKNKLRTRMLLQVHDELVLETPEEEKEAATSLVCSVMEAAYTLDVPLKVDVEIGPNWYDLTHV